MKKVLLSTLLAGIIGSAQAYDLGVTGGSDIHSGKGVYSTAGVNATAHDGKFSTTVEMDREFNGNTNKYSLVGGYDFAKLGTIVFTAKAGVAYVNQLSSTDGYAALAGVGVSVPVFDKVSATVDYRYQSGQDRIESVNGSTFLVGARYSF
jgi:hypothetical protein